MTQPAPAQPDPVVQVTAGLADTPMGQRVAIMIAALLPKDQAELIGKAITDLAASMSASGLVVPAPSANGLPQVPS